MDTYVVKKICVSDWWKYLECVVGLTDWFCDCDYGSFFSAGLAKCDNFRHFLSGHDIHSRAEG